MTGITATHCFVHNYRVRLPTGTHTNTQHKAQCLLRHARQRMSIINTDRRGRERDEGMVLAGQGIEWKLPHFSLVDYSSQLLHVNHLPGED